VGHPLVLGYPPVLRHPLPVSVPTWHPNWPHGRSPRPAAAGEARAARGAAPAPAATRGVGLPPRPPASPPAVTAPGSPPPPSAAPRSAARAGRGTRTGCQRGSPPGLATARPRRYLLQRADGIELALRRRRGRLLRVALPRHRRFARQRCRWAQLAVTLRHRRRSLTPPCSSDRRPKGEGDMAAAVAYRGGAGNRGPQVVLSWWLCHVLGAALLP